MYNGPNVAEPSRSGRICLRPTSAPRPPASRAARTLRPICSASPRQCPRVGRAGSRQKIRRAGGRHGSPTVRRQRRCALDLRQIKAVQERAVVQEESGASVAASCRRTCARPRSNRCRLPVRFPVECRRGLQPSPAKCTGNTTRCAAVRRPGPSKGRANKAGSLARAGRKPPPLARRASGTLSVAQAASSTPSAITPPAPSTTVYFGHAHRRRVSPPAPRSASSNSASSSARLASRSGRVRSRRSMVAILCSSRRPHSYPEAPLCCWPTTCFSP